MNRKRKENHTSAPMISMRNVFTFLSSGMGITFASTSTENTDGGQASAMNITYMIMNASGALKAKLQAMKLAPGRCTQGRNDSRNTRVSAHGAIHRTTAGENRMVQERV